MRHSLLDPERLTPRDIDAFMPTLDRGMRLFVEASQQPQLLADIGALAGRKESPSHTVNIRSEQDISQARVLAKAICEHAGARSFVAQKVEAVVSELARTILSDTPGGAIELVLSSEGESPILIRATDTGGEIPNPDEVLSGKYRSRTGPGRGSLDG